MSAGKAIRKLICVQRKIEKGVVSGFKKIEKTVVSGYKKIENGTVSGYKKIEDKFVDTFWEEDPRKSDN